MSFWEDIIKPAAKAVAPLLGPAGIAIGAGATIAGSMISADNENKALRRQVDEYNKNLEKQAVRTYNLAASEGIGQQAAYNWASNMIRKHQDNPAALQSATSIAANKLQSSSERAAQLRAAAIDILSKRMVKPRRLTGAQLAMTGLRTGIDTASSIANIVSEFKKGDE
ncbi:MAG: hypothetical protein RBS96_07050 [Dehalococcoidales bacterium]|jgi:hypothetical protein|nr:hypothetical protein [Dehalococcoidales bacterium]